MGTLGVARADHATRIGGPNGPKPGGKAGSPVISERRVRSIQRKAAIEAALHADDPKLDCDGLGFLQDVYRDPKQPIGLRIGAADRAAKYEVAPVKPAPLPEPPKGPGLDLLRLSDQERQVFLLLAEKAAGRAPPPPPAPVVETAQSNPERGSITDPQRQRLRDEFVGMLAVARDRGLPEAELREFEARFKREFGD